MFKLKIYINLFSRTCHATLSFFSNNTFIACVCNICCACTMMPCFALHGLPTTSPRAMDSLTLSLRVSNKKKKIAKEWVSKIWGKKPSTQQATLRELCRNNKVFDRTNKKYHLILIVMTWLAVSTAEVGMGMVKWVSRTSKKSNQLFLLVLLL